MLDADAIVLEALLDDVLTPDVLEDAVDGAMALLTDDADDVRRKRLEAELAKVDAERERLVSAIAAGGPLESLVAGVTERERRRSALTSELQAIAAQRPARTADTARLRWDLLSLASEWRLVLADDPQHARPIVSQLLVGRVSFLPLETKGRWEMKGEGTLAGLFTREVFPSVWRPRRDSQICGSGNWPEL